MTASWRVEVFRDGGAVHLTDPSGDDSNPSGLPALVVQAVAVAAAQKRESLKPAKTLSGGTRNRPEIRDLITFGKIISFKHPVTTDVGEWYDASRRLAELTAAEAIAFIDGARQWITPAVTRHPDSSVAVGLAVVIESADDDRRDALQTLAAGHEPGVRAAATAALNALGWPLPDIIAHQRPGYWLTDSQMSEHGELLGRDEAVCRLVGQVQACSETGGVVALCSRAAMGRNRVASAILHRLLEAGWVVGAIGPDPDAGLLELARSLEPDRRPPSVQGARACVRNRLPACAPWCIVVDAASMTAATPPPLPRIEGGAWLVIADEPPVNADHTERLAPLDGGRIERILATESRDRLKDRAAEIAPSLGGSPSLAAYVGQLANGPAALTADEIVDALADQTLAGDLVSEALRRVGRVYFDRLEEPLQDTANCLALLADSDLPAAFVDELDSRGPRAFRPLRALAANADISLAMFRPIALALRAQMTPDTADVLTARIVRAIARMAARHPAAADHEGLLKMVPHVAALLPALAARPDLAAELVDPLLAITEAQWSIGRRSAAITLLNEATTRLPNETRFAELELQRLELLQASGTGGAHLEAASAVAAGLQDWPGGLRSMRISGGLARIARGEGAGDRARDYARSALEIAIDGERCASTAVDRALARRHLAEVLQDLDGAERLGEARGLLVDALEDLSGGTGDGDSSERTAVAVKKLVSAEPVHRFTAVSVLRAASTVERTAGDSRQANELLTHVKILQHGMPVHDSRLVQARLVEGLVQLDRGSRKAAEIADTVIKVAGEDAAAAPVVQMAQMIRSEARLIDWQQGTYTGLPVLGADTGEALRWAVEPWARAIAACAKAVDERTSYDNAYAAAEVKEAAETMRDRRGAMSQAVLKLERLRWTLVAREQPEQARDALLELQDRAAGEHREGGMIALTVAWLLPENSLESRRHALHAQQILTRTVGDDAAVTRRAAVLADVPPTQPPDRDPATRRSTSPTPPRRR